MPFEQCCNIESTSGAIEAPIFTGRKYGSKLIFDINFYSGFFDGIQQWLSPFFIAQISVMGSYTIP